MTDRIVQSFIDRLGLRRESHSPEHLEKIACEFSRLPYENITKIIAGSEHGETDGKFRMPGRVLDDFERFSSGGTCFSLTYTFMEILRNFGYESRPVMADMNHGENIHCALMVRLRGKELLIDPGYLIFRPVELSGEAGSEIKTRSGSVIIKPAERGRFAVFTADAEGEKQRYVLKTAEVGESEFERYWRDSFSMAMMHSIVVTGFRNGEQLYLRNDYFRTAGAWGKKTLKIKNDYHHKLEKIFGISSELVLRALRILEEEHGRKLKVYACGERD